MSEKAQITTSFYTSLATVAAIIVGWLFIETRLKDTFEEVLRPIKDDVEQSKQDIKNMRPIVDLSAYRVNQHEQIMQEYLKPEDIKRKSYK